MALFCRKLGSRSPEPEGKPAGRIRRWNSVTLRRGELTSERHSQNLLYFAGTRALAAVWPGASAVISQAPPASAPAGGGASSSFP